MDSFDDASNVSTESHIVQDIEAKFARHLPDIVKFRKPTIWAVFEAAAPQPHSSSRGPMKGLVLAVTSHPIVTYIQPLEVNLQSEQSEP